MSQPILHILPEDGIGGAEIAAHSASAAHPNVTLLFLKNTNAQAVEGGTSNVRYAATNRGFSRQSFRTGLSIYDATSPAIVVFSLWKCFPLFLLLRILRPKMNAVLMLHSSKHMHVFDWFCTRMMQLMANEVWCDSKSTLHRLQKSHRKSTRIVSFLAHKPQAVAPANPVPRFIYWGRLTQVKNLPLALRLFHKIHASHPKARFTLIGPDGGELAKLNSMTDELNLTKAVDFMGEKDWKAIQSHAANASFFIQLSHFEGMAMSVVEAMQLGLVTIVTPVGEIAQYGKDGENCILFQDVDQAAAAVNRVLSEPNSYQKLSQNAQETWVTQSTYADDFYATCLAQVAKVNQLNT